MTIKFTALIDHSPSEDDFLHVFQDACSQQNQNFIEAHRTILRACYQSPDLAPSLQASTLEGLATAWILKYTKAYENRISKRISKPPSTVADPIVDTIINSRLTELTPEHLEQIKYAHRLSMSAENIQGLLLEEFLAEELANYGWYCCWGETLRHVDFCHINGSLLQVKNRSNSENSSSSRVRLNRPIEKWYRVDAQTGVYRWSYFNKKYDTNRFSEENFISFVERVLSDNPRALAIEDNNPWKNISSQSDKTER